MSSDTSHQGGSPGSGFLLFFVLGFLWELTDQQLACIIVSDFGFQPIKLGEAFGQVEQLQGRR